jgi:thiamine-phosphate pyrophosphorylase
MKVGDLWVLAWHETTQMREIARGALGPLTVAPCCGRRMELSEKKHDPVRELESLARKTLNILNRLRTQNPELRTALLINSRIDVSLAAGADGVHLRSDDISPRDVKQIWQRTGVGPGRDPLIGVSCHSPEEVRTVAANGATFAAFGPIFEKKHAPKVNSAGLAQLQEACHHNIPVFALGGITLSNAQSCLETGAAGIAAIRLFQENDVAAVVQNLSSE